MKRQPMHLPAGLSLALAALWLLMPVRSQALQDATPTPAPLPVTLTCDTAELIRRQAELSAALDSFALDLNADPTQALDALFRTGVAYQELAQDCGYIPPDAATRTIGTDVDRILNQLTSLYGDPINGQVLYNGELACASCHLIGGGQIAPHTEGTYTRLLDTRLKDPLLAGYTEHQYLVESIVQPTHYVVTGYQPVMPTDYGGRLTLQDLADLIAYLESQDGPSPE